MTLAKNASACFLTTLFLAHSAIGDPLSYWFEDISDTNGSLLKTVSFDSVPGVEYRIQGSPDLLSWSNQHTLYGLGNQFSLVMTTVTPSTAPPPGPVLEHGPPVSLTLRPCSDPQGGFVLSLMDSAYGEPVSTWIQQTLDPVWASVPLMVIPMPEYSFFVVQHTLPAPPPIVVIPETAPAHEIFAFFEENLSAITQLLIAQNSATASAPISSSSNAESKHFFRIISDYSLDTDGDGSPDHVEFALMDNPSHSSYFLADVNNADVNGDGIADGNSIDIDQDGVADTKDASIKEPVIDWERGLEPRFATFGVAAPVDSVAETPDIPLQVNDQGVALFTDNVWIAGQNEALDDSGPDIENCVAWGMNNLGEIIGTGFLISSETLSPGAQGIVTPQSPVLAYWGSREAEPVPVFRVEDGEKIYPASVWHADLANADPNETNHASITTRDFPYDCLIDDDARFLGLTEQLGIWQRQPDGSFTEAAAPDDSLRFTLAPNVSWGLNEDGKTVIYGGGNDHLLEERYQRIVRRPNGMLAAVRAKGPLAAFVSIGGAPASWVKATNPNFTHFVDMSQRSGLLAITPTQYDLTATMVADGSHSKLDAVWLNGSAKTRLPEQILDHGPHGPFPTQYRNLPHRS